MGRPVVIAVDLTLCRELPDEASDLEMSIAMKAMHVDFRKWMEKHNLQEGHVGDDGKFYGHGDDEE